MIFPRDKNHSKGAITCLQLLQTAVPAPVPWATLTPTTTTQLGRCCPLIHEQIYSLLKTLRIYSYGLGESQGHFCIPALSTGIINNP